MIFMGIVARVFGLVVMLVVFGEQPIVLLVCFFYEVVAGWERFLRVKRFGEEPVEVAAMVGYAKKDGLTDFSTGIFCEEEV